MSEFLGYVSFITLLVILSFDNQSFEFGMSTYLGTVMSYLVISEIHA